MTFLSKEKKLAFIHIPKTAGRSFSNLLQHSNIKNDLMYNFMGKSISNRLLGILPYWYFPRKNGLGKLRALEVYYGGHLTRSMIEYNMADDYQYFAVVRNPFSMVISSFQMLQRSKRNDFQSLINHKDSSFKNYVDLVCKTSFNQFDYIQKRGEISNVTIGYFEDMESFEVKVRREFEINKSFKLPMLNKSNKSLCVFGVEERKKIEKAFKRDLDIFGYSYRDFINLHKES